VFCRDLHSLAVLVVHDVEGAVGDEDTVPGAEAALDIFGIIEPLFNQHDGVGRDLLRFGEKFKNIGGITAGAFLHLLVVPGEVFGEVFGGVLPRAVLSLCSHRLWASVPSAAKSLPLSS